RYRPDNDNQDEAIDDSFDPALLCSGFARYVHTSSNNLNGSFVPSRRFCLTDCVPHLSTNSICAVSQFAFQFWEPRVHKRTSEQRNRRAKSETTFGLWLVIAAFSRSRPTHL